MHSFCVPFFWLSSSRNPRELLPSTCKKKEFMAIFLFFKGYLSRNSFLQELCSCKKLVPFLPLPQKCNNSPAWLGNPFKILRNSPEFRNYSDSKPFELWNFHWNFIFPIVKCVSANSEHVFSGLKSSPAIDSSNFMNRKTFPLYMSVASGIKFRDSMHQLFSRAPLPSHCS